MVLMVVMRVLLMLLLLLLGWKRLFMLGTDKKATGTVGVSGFGGRRWLDGLDY